MRGGAALFCHSVKKISVNKVGVLAPRIPWFVPTHLTDSCISRTRVHVHIIVIV